MGDPGKDGVAAEKELVSCRFRSKVKESYLVLIL